MFSWIPVEYYGNIYYQLLLIVVLIMSVNSRSTGLADKTNLFNKRIAGNVLFCFVLLYIGLRPINGVFVDMTTYARSFEELANGAEMSGKDIGFEMFVKLCSNLMSVDVFFLLCAFLYIVPMYLAAKKLFVHFWFYGFLILLCSFSFWNYGVNGIRNGMATSFMLLAFAYFDKKSVYVPLITLSICFHSSMSLLLVAFVITVFYNNTKAFLYLWLVCIPVSLVAGGYFSELFSNIGFDDRLSSYLSVENAEVAEFGRTGFRWDFLVYSASAVAVGSYFIFVKAFSDKYYHRLFNIYLFSNAFWVLLIRASFSNRFAYLSWFMMGIVIIYPFLRKKFFKQQHVIVMNCIAAYFMFTYLMSVIL